MPTTAPSVAPSSPQRNTATSSGPSTGGGFGRFVADLAKRDITGSTEEQRAAAAARRAQEPTRQPAQPAVYDETASDWEVKIEQMEDVLPHVPRHRLAEALKACGGDEERAIGFAVINRR